MGVPTLDPHPLRNPVPQVASMIAQQKLCLSRIPDDHDEFFDNGEKLQRVIALDEPSFEPPYFSHNNFSSLGHKDDMQARLP